MPNARKDIGVGVVGPEKQTLSLLQGRYCFENFMQEPSAVSKKGALAAPEGTALCEQTVFTGRHQFEFAYIGTQTLLYPVLASDGGWDWGLDQTAADGVEIGFGGLKPGHPRNYMPSREEFFARLLIHVEDASGIDAFFGFRKLGAYAASLTEYYDVCGIRILGDSSSTTGAFTIITNLNSTTTDYTETTTSVTGLEDATAVELEVRVSGSRAAFLVNGVAVSTAPSFTFDADEVWIPVARFIHTTDVAGRVKTLAYESGLMADRNPSSLLTLAGATD